MTDWKALCQLLVSHMAYMQGQLEAQHELDELEDYYWYRESEALRKRVADALACCGSGQANLDSSAPAPIPVSEPLWRAMARHYDESSAPAGTNWQDHHGYAAEICAVRDHLFPAGRPGDDSCCDVMQARLWDQLTTEADRAERGEVTHD